MATTPGIPGDANVNAAKELRAAMEAMAGIVGNLERSFNNQASAIRDMAKAMGSLGVGDIAAQVNQLGESFKQALAAIQQLSGQTTAALGGTTAAVQGAAAATQNLGGQIRDAGAAAANAGKPTQNLGNILGDVSEETQSLDQKLKKVGKYLKKEHPVAVGAALGAMSGLAQGFRNIVAVGKAVYGVFESLIGFAYELGVSLIQIPFKIFDGLLSMARKAGGGSELATAIEKVRENFGHLTNQTPKAIFATARSLDKLNFGGISAYRIFGNLAQRIEKINTLFMTGGPAIRNLTDEFIKSGPIILGYQKGLGLSDEMIGSIAQQAQSMGKPMTKILNDITKQSLHLGEAFKLDAKIISREMGKAAMDMKHFGDVSIKQIGVAVTYAHKLGIDLEKVTGIMDSFSTFDSAAENVSKLNEAFGTNISAMEMLQAESPDQQLEILRKEMARVGVDGEKLNRHYRSLITQTTSLDDATIKAAFSSKNQGVSLKEIQKQSEKAEKKTMSQTEAMNKLSGAMERIVESGSLSDKGFFGQFFQGIEDGIMRTAEFRKIMMNIATALRVVYQEGLRLGGQIVQLFPGLKEFLGGLGDLFSPAKFQKLARGVSDVIIEWMKGLTDPSKKFSFGALMDKIQEKFFNFFSMEEPAGRKTVSGFKKILDVISVALGEFVKWAAEKLTSFFRFAAEFIKNPSSVINLQGAQEGVMGFLGPLFQAIAESWPALWGSFKELMTVAFQKLFEWVSTSLWPVIEPYMKYVYTGLAIILFGPAVGQALLGAAIGFFTQLLVKAVAAGATKAAASGLLGEAMKKLFSASQSAGAPAAVPGLTPTLAAAPPPQVVAGAAASGAALQPAQPSIIALLGALAAIIVMGLVAFYLAAKMVESMSTETVLKAMGALASVMLSSVPAAYAAIAIAKVGNPAEVLRGGGILGLLVVIMSLAIIPLIGIMSLIEGVSFETLAKTLVVLSEVILAAIPAALASVAIAKSGASAWSIIKGGLVIGALVTIMSVTGLLMAGILSMGDPARLVAAGSFMVALAKVFLLMVPLVVGAMAVGALFAGGFFAAGSIALLAIGMGVITALVADVTITAQAIMAAIEKMPMSAGFEIKSKIFLGIMEAIQKLADALVTVLSLMQPSFMELISGVSFSDKVNKAVELLKAFIGSKQEGTGIMGLIELVFKTIKELAGSGNSSNIVAIGNVFAGMLTAIADLVKGLTPPGEYFTAQTDFINVLDPSIGKSMDQTFKGYVQIFTGQVTEIIGQLKTTIETFLKYRSLITDVKKAEIISSMLSALSKAIVSVTPSKDLIKVFTETYEESKSGGKTLTKIDSKALSESMMTNAILAESIMKTLADKIIPSLLAAGAGLTQAQLQQALKIADLFKTLPDFINSLSNVLQHGFSELKTEKSSTTETIMGDDKAVLFTNTTLVNKIKETFDLLKQNLPDLIGTIVGFVSTMKVDSSFSQKANALKAIFEAIKSITDSISSISQTFKGEQKEGELKSAADLLTARSTELMQVGPVLGTFLQSFNITSIAEGINQLHERMSKAAGGKNLRQSANTIDELFKAVTTLSDTMGKIPKIENPGSVGENLKSIGDALQQFTTGDKGKSPFDVMKESFVGTNSLSASASIMSGGIKSFTKFFDDIFIPFVRSIVSVNTEIDAAKQSGGGLYSLAMAMKGLVGTEESRKTLKDSLGAMAEDAEHVAASSIAPIVVSIQKINAEGKKLSEALTKGDWITQLPVALKTFAQKSGTNLIGMGTKYTIGTSPVVINITLAVAMDAKQIETAVIMRKDSYIRDRVHYLLQLAAGSDAIKVDELIKKGTASTTALTAIEKEGKIPIEGTDPGYAAKENQTEKS